MDKKTKKKVIFWTPRGLLIAFAAFISIFALDSFTEFAFPESIVAFLIHLIPTFLLLGVLWFVWKRPFWGGWLFLGIGLLFTIFFKLYADFISFLLIGLPVFIVSALFFTEKRMYGKKKVKIKKS